MTIPEKPKSPERIAADKNSKDQCCIVFRMAFAQRNRRVLRLVTTAITTKDVNNMAVAANVRLAISMSDSRADFLAQHKFQSALRNHPSLQRTLAARPSSSPAQHNQKHQYDDH
jgi:hypothetical protein